jgi:hypothetical protein
MAESRVRPFFCGSQSCEWESSNCSGCGKDSSGEEDDIKQVPYVIRKAFFYAYFGDGTVSHKIADMMDRPKGRYTWPCPSRDPRWPEEDYGQGQA